MDENRVSSETAKLANYSSITSASFALARSFALSSNFLVSFCTSSFVDLQSSSVSDLVFLLLVGLLVGVAADVADGDLRFLGQLLGAGDHLPAHVARERRDVEADHLAVALRREAQVAGDDALFDVLDRRRDRTAESRAAAARAR